MLRALSSRSRRGGYERLLANNDDSCSTCYSSVVPIDHVSEITLKRAKTLPVGKLDSLFSTKKTQTQKPLKTIKEKEVQVPQKKKKNTTSHPLFSLFDGRRRNKKATAKPEFTRYLEYVREGGMWDISSNKPVIYFK